MTEREKRRGERLLLEKKRSVIIAPIGSDARYRLETRNVSNQGFFLEFDNPERFPFRAASIMEVWFDIGEEKPIFFNAKMTRVIKPEDDEASFWGAGISVKIIQITQENEDRLEAYIDKEMENTKNSVSKGSSQAQVS